MKILNKDKTLACEQEGTKDRLSWIIHMDMDAFFASVEQKDFPELKGKAVIVGKGERGVVTAASYEARAFGVRSAMPLGEARRLCPHAIFQAVRKDRYQEVSQSIMQALQNLSPCVEIASIDEAYIDATGFEHLYPSILDFAKRIQEEVFIASEGLSCSLGIAPIKFMAKIASDMKKPRGITLISHEELPHILQSLPVGKIPGVGKKMLNELRLLGIKSCADVQKFPQSFFIQRFGKVGEQIYDRSQGIDSRKVENEQEIKSCSAEITLNKDTSDKNLLQEILYKQAVRVGKALRKNHLQGTHIGIKIKYSNFTSLTRQRTLPYPTCATKTLFEQANSLLQELELGLPVRLIGLSVSGFEQKRIPKQESYSQISLLTKDPQLETMQTEAERTRIDKLIDALQNKFDKKALERADLLSDQNTNKPE